MNLLMVTGDRNLAQGKKGPFWNTISEFHKHWKRIDIITPGIPTHRYDMVMFGNVFIHPSPLPLFFQPLWIWYKGRAILRSNGYPLMANDYLMTVHSYPPFYNDLGAWLLHKSAIIPYVSEVLHVPGVPRTANPKEFVYRLMAKFFFRFWARPAMAVRVMNKHETPDFLARSGVPRSKLVHIPAVYIDTEVFRPREVSKKFDLIFVGRLVPNKGIKLFLEVVRLTRLRALIVGDGPLRKWAELKANSSNLNADFFGFAKDQQEVAELMNSARLLVMLSDNEGGPRVVPESLACGTPVLATPVGIVPDILPPEAIEEWDAQALADKVTNILGDPQLYARLRESGLESASGFEKKAAVKNYADELKRLMQ